MTETQAKPESPRDPTALVTVGGRERELRFNMWSVCQLEEATGQPWHAVVSEIRRDFGRANVRLLWACLQHEPKPPTLRELAQSLPTDGSARAAFDAAFQVMVDSLPKPEAREEDPLAPEAVASAA